MPELPEVETIKNDLKEKILNKKITETVVRKKGIIRGSALKFSQILENNSFVDIGRIGKLIIFKLNQGGFMLVHLKMTGQLVYEFGSALVAGGHFTDNFQTLPNKHSHVIFKFKDGSELYYNDLRQFGFLEIVDQKTLEIIKDKYGLEPLTSNFTLENFKKALAGRRVAVKAALLNQSIIAGIGNIYADEILFAAGIAPYRGVNSLSERELKNIFQAISAILKKAIKYRGTTFSNYVDSSGRKGGFSRFLRAYGRGGQKCHKCGQVIKKVKLAGRGTSYCENCQK